MLTQNSALRLIALTRKRQITSFNLLRTKFNVKRLQKFEKFENFSTSSSSTSESKSRTVSPSSTPSSTDSSSSSSSSSHVTIPPRWVTSLNKSLESYPVETAIAYVVLDASSVISIFALYTFAQISVPANFALAFGISRALRRFRLPVDIAVAAVLLKLYPPLSLVKPSRLLGIDTTSSSSSTTGATGVIQRAGATMANAADKFGLSFFVSQRLTGLASVSTLYLLISSGMDVEATLSSIFGADLVALATGSGAGAAIGLWAAAAVSASAVYPLVILGAGPLGFFIGGLKKSFNVAK
jgi:hypothetical protein